MLLCCYYALQMLPRYACPVYVAVARVKILFLLAAALSFMQDSVATPEFVCSLQQEALCVLFSK